MVIELSEHVRASWPRRREAIRRGLDDRAPLMFDAESIAAGDPADFARRHVTLSRNCENGGKAFGYDGNDGASAALGEEREFGSRVIVELDGRAQRKRTGLKTGHYRRGREAGFD